MVYRRAMALRPVKSLKHVIDATTATIDAVVTTVPLATAVATAALASPEEVQDACTINSIYLRAEAVTTEVFTLQPSIYMIVYKDPGDNLSSDPSPNNVGPNPNKRHVIHQEMVMMSKDPAISSFPRTVFNGVIKLPRGIRRMGLQDKLKALFQGPPGETTGQTQLCVQCIYKEFR